MPLNEDNVSHAYQVPRSHEAPCVMSSYDTPNGTLEPDGPHYFEVEELTNKSASLEFAVGTQYHSAATGPPVTAPSYNNPLESEPHANSQNGFYDNPGMKGKKYLGKGVRKYRSVIVIAVAVFFFLLLLLFLMLLSLFSVLFPSTDM